MPWGRLAAAGVGVLAIVAVATGPSDQPGASSPVVETGVVLAEDPPAPSPSPTRAAPTTGPRVDVVCSDLRRRSVPEALVGGAEPGMLADLSWGPCVVMGPEGVAVP